MKGKRPPTIEGIGKALLKQLEEAGWEVGIEDDYSDFKEYYCKSDSGPLKAFTRLNLLLMTLNDDPASVEMRFIFFANPQIVGPNKRPFGKLVRESNFKALRDVCEELLKKAGIEAKEEETYITPKANRNLGFGEDRLPAAYEVQLVYWKRPI